MEKKNEDDGSIPFFLFPSQCLPPLSTFGFNEGIPIRFFCNHSTILVKTREIEREGLFFPLRSTHHQLLLAAAQLQLSRRLDPTRAFALHGVLLIAAILAQEGALPASLVGAQEGPRVAADGDPAFVGVEG